MKNNYFTFVLLFVITNLTAQDFAPVGAQWHYNERFAFSGDIDFIKFTSEKDTLINGEMCRKIIKRHKLPNNRPDTEFLFTRNDTVFFLDTAFNGFQILYDFNATSQESWIIKVKDETQDIDTVLVTVDSTSIAQINGFDLKALHVSYSKSDEYVPEYFLSTIIERIGDIAYLFNWNPWSLMLVDGNWTDGLRCYEDPVIGLYETGLADSCEYVYNYIGVEEVQIVSDFSIFPNPSNGVIYIQSENIENIQVQVIDLYGRMILNDQIESGGDLNLSKYPKGIYLLKIQRVDEIVYRKVILE